MSDLDGDTALIPPSGDFMYRRGKFRQQIVLASGKRVYVWGRLRGTLPMMEVASDEYVRACGQELAHQSTTL